MAEWYAQAVVQGAVVACRWERLGCHRFLHMLQEAKKPRSEFIFDADRANDACAFIETLPHIKGFAGTIILEPVQCWWLAAIFGFRERDTGRRWVREVAFWVPRKNAKTALSVGIVLYCLNYEGEPGAEGCVAAGSEKQADIPYLAIRQTLEKEQELRSWLMAKDTTETIKFRRTGAELKLLAGRAPNLDGLNPHVVLAEEVHAQNQDVIGVLKSAQGARQQPLWLGISTAGRNASGPAYDGWKSDQQVLEGKLRADRVFVAMYAADPGDEDNRFDPGVVEKLNPLYGISLNPTSLETEEREARKSEAKLQEYKRTRLNIWSRAAGNLFSVEQWDACGDRKLTLDALKGFPMFVGVDLASHSDLNAACFLICVEDVLYAVFRYWLPERSPRFQDDRYADQFQAWADAGYLTLTKGSHVHHPTIRNDVLGMIRGHNVAGFAFDQHQADYLMGEVEAEGYTAYIVPKVARHITYATDDIMTRHAEPSRFQHDGNPISSWMAGNVVGHRDANDNVLPKKEQRGSKQSIDGMDALISADAARLQADAGNIAAGIKVEKPSIYMNRGLIGFS
ncbi:terminase large subunit [Methylobacterium radiotolerans]|jgi:phage terminase large subunit-like protein|nr:terminase TerL endonuclease subunit [Methylobacterium radiotolerans]GAN49696.1 terminase [Methylobacterium sp. ME121]